MSLHPVETVLLPALQGVRKAPARAGALAAWRASCPLHEAKNSDLSVAISSDGAPLLHCFCRHSPIDVFEYLGIDWTDLHPHGTNPCAAHARGNGGPHEWAPVYSSGEACLRALEKAFSLLARTSETAKPEEFEEYLRSIFEAADQLQKFKKFMRAAARWGNAK